MKEDRKPGYWAVIPADVRYDPDLPPNAKLLYAEISALCDRGGYCFASNAYFAGLYGLSLTTVQRLIKALADRGHIRVEVIRDPTTNEVQERRIYAGVNPAEVVTPPSPQKCGEGSPQKCDDPSPQNCGVDQLSKDLNNIPPISPQGGTAVPKYKPEWFEAFWRAYPLHASKPKAIRAWDKLKPDRALCAVMSKALDAQKQSPRWWDADTKAFRKEYIPYPSTWLNQRQWENDVIQAASSGAPPDDGRVEERRLPVW